MSHTVTITRTTTSTSGSACFINTGYLGTVPGLLKLAQLLLGAACVGLVAYYWDNEKTSYYVRNTAELFYLLVAVAFLIGTFCLLLSCLITLSTASIISKTIYEVVYHSIAFAMYLAAGVTLIVEANNYKNSRSNIYDGLLSASVMGLVMAALYLASTFYAHRSYRGI